MKIAAKLGNAGMARAFVVAAAALSAGCAAVAVASFLDADLSQALLLGAVSVFSAWMATAIHQFHDRMSGIDEVVRQARRRVEQSDLVLAEMRQLAQRLRASSAPEDTEEDRTLH